MVTAEDPISGEKTHTNQAHLVFVALNDQGRPTAVPPLLLEDQESKELFAAGKKRQERRINEKKGGL